MIPYQMPTALETPGDEAMPENEIGSSPWEG